ncbi:hypothetical protein [Ralstonia solanacearum]|uniref:hypothetical protein n=1 Tax=Ralstonia solanacearum TaxID=305 RepID=UPI001E53F2B7|nr:hypothetical protein [Ralstonia solanacearum]
MKREGVGEKRKNRNPFNLERVKAGLVLGFIFVGIVGLIGVVCFPVFFIISASSPVIRWRVMNCHYDDFVALIVEALMPYFLFGVLFGSALNLRPKLGVGYVATAFLCLAISAGLLIATFEDPPPPECGAAKEILRRDMKVIAIELG